MLPHPHLYRRGDIYWWRRVLCLYPSGRCDMRLSLRTADKRQALERAAALTASTRYVRTIMEERITRRADERPSEVELRAMAKAEFENQLGRYCDSQRQHPRQAATHSVFNLAYADYYQRLIDSGGRPELEPDDEADLARLGWSEERLDRLKQLIRHHHEGGQPAIKPSTLSFHLRQAGFEPNRLLMEIVERALWPAYRDACLEAEQALPAPATLTQAAPYADSPAAPPTNPSTGPTLPEIAAGAARDLKADRRWDDKLCRQAKSTAALFVLVIGSKPFGRYTQQDLASFKRKLRRLPTRYDMTSEKSRAVVLAAATREEARPGDGLSTPTMNRHLTVLRVMQRWASLSGIATPAWVFDELRVEPSRRQRERHQRPSTAAQDLEKLFALPIFTGSQPHRGGTGQAVLRARFTPGQTLVHDAFYWVPLLTYYTGARREEVCKLRPDDFDESGGIAFVKIDETPTGRVKNDSSVRIIPLHRELIRLGLLDFVNACARAGRDVLFPELRPANSVQKFGDVFYKRCWTHLRAKGGLSPTADIHGARHRFSTALKARGVPSEVRGDLLGHVGKTITEERYSDSGEVSALKVVVDELPSLTDHLLCHPVNLTRQ